ncbi:MAG: DEAD/DEAH box helicase [Nanoarchaeota archaeon]
MNEFAKLGLSAGILKLISDAGIESPTDIQEKAIPLVLSGKDVLGSSATGSGKTLAFGAGIIEKVTPRSGIQALVLTPTRELAEQVGKTLEKYSKHVGLKVIEVYGGVSIVPQKHDLRIADIVVGTPGRILDHLRSGSLNLNKLKFLVLDEADRMLDMGFIDDVVTIINQCPKQRQTLLFSATISSDISRIAKHYMIEPVLIESESQVDPSKLHQVYYDVPSNLKFSLLVHLLRAEKKGLVMVFCNTRRNADYVVHNLQRNKIDAIAIHGGLAQNKRSRIMEQFHSSHALILVCTDVAARGLDIKNVSHVYNFDVPKTSIEYIHRIGRTARAGKEGIAITIVAQRDYDSFRRVLSDPSVNIKQESMPEVESIAVRFKESEGDRDNRGRLTFGGARGFGGRRDFGNRNSGGASRRFGGSDSSRGGGRSFGGSHSGRNSRDGDRRDSGGRGGGRSFGAGRGRRY